MKQIQTNSTAVAKKNVINRVSDIPGGVSIVLSTLIAGAVVPEAIPLTAPTDGKRSVCKQGVLLAGSTTTLLVVETSTNHFKVGDIVFEETGGAAYAITAVTDVGDGTTTLAIPTALESAVAGTYIYQGDVAGADTGALENTPDVIVKDGFEVPLSAQVIWMSDALLRADVIEDCIGALYLATLPHIGIVKY